MRASLLRLRTLATLATLFLFPNAQALTACGWSLEIDSPAPRSFDVAARTASVCDIVGFTGLRDRNEAETLAARMGAGGEDWGLLIQGEVIKPEGITETAAIVWRKSAAIYAGSDLTSQVNDHLLGLTARFVTPKGPLVVGVLDHQGRPEPASVSVDHYMVRVNQHYAGDQTRMVLFTDLERQDMVPASQLLRSHMIRLDLPGRKIGEGDREGMVLVPMKAGGFLTGSGLIDYRGKFPARYPRGVPDDGARRYVSGQFPAYVTLDGGAFDISRFSNFDQMAPAVDTVVTPAQQGPVPEGRWVKADFLAKTYIPSDCRIYDAFSSRALVTLRTPEEAEGQGYKLASLCRPD